jgi:hypothetical protein
LDFSLHLRVLSLGERRVPGLLHFPGSAPWVAAHVYLFSNNNDNHKSIRAHFQRAENASFSLSLFRSFSRACCVLRVRLFPRINEEEYVLWGEKMTDAALYEGKK